MVKPKQFHQSKFEIIAIFQLGLTNHNSYRSLDRFEDRSASNDRAFCSFLGTRDLDHSLGCPLDSDIVSVEFRLAVFSFGRNA